MNTPLLSIKPTYLLIKSSILNLLSYLSYELNYIYIQSNESDEFNEFGLECYSENDIYPNSTTKYAKEDNNDNKNNWGLWVFTEECDINNEV